MHPRRRRRDPISQALHELLDAPSESTLERLHGSVRAAVLPVCRAYPDVSRVYLFGSMARGDCTPASDVDLWVHVDDSIIDGNQRLSTLIIDFERAIPRGSDIVTATEPHEIRKIYKRLMREKVLLYDRETVR